MLQHSATECVPNQARHNHIPIDADHRGINKFATRSNHNFLQVRSHILALVNVAQENVDRQALQKGKPSKTNLISGYYSECRRNGLD